MNSELNLSTGRRYDIDWLRIALIISVFFFHIGMFFNGFGWHIKNNEEISWLNPIMAYLHRWRMPLLFFVSGVGTYFALGKRNIGQYIKERSNRLMIPLVFGMFVIVPPQVYIEKQEQFGSFLNFIPHMAEGSYPEGNMSWHHLWFVLYLFVCSLVGIPIILLLRSRFKSAIYNLFIRISQLRGSYLLLAVPLWISQLLLRPYFPNETHALVDDWAYWIYNFLFFIYGYIIYSNHQLINNLIQQRRFYAIVGILMSVVFFYDYYHSVDSWISENIQLLLGSVFEWSVGMTIIAYTGKYLNKEHSWRKYLNEAIYPFYILHQTVIVIIGFYLVNASISNGLKALILTIGSLVICVSIYLLLIRPFNVLRIPFGMRKLNSDKTNSIKWKSLKKVA